MSEFNVKFNELSPTQLFAKLNTYGPLYHFIKLIISIVYAQVLERYIRNKNNKVISQPIKGTESRGSMIESDKNKKLINSQKDFSENVMIVDLVRNDLSITAKIQLKRGTC